MSISDDNMFTYIIGVIILALLVVLMVIGLTMHTYTVVCARQVGDKDIRVEKIESFNDSITAAAFADSLSSRFGRVCVSRRN